MCRTCWVDKGRPRDLPPNGAEIVALIDRLYQQPDSSAGGPLHALLDDYNLDCVEPWLDAEWLPSTVELANQIADRMRPLTEAQRGAIIAEREAWINPRPPTACPHGSPDHTNPEPVTYRITWPEMPDGVAWGCATHAEKIKRYQATLGRHVELHPLPTAPT